MQVRPSTFGLAVLLSIPNLSGTPFPLSSGCDPHLDGFCLDERGLTIGMIRQNRDASLSVMRTEPYSRRPEYFGTAGIHSRETVMRCRQTLDDGNISLLQALKEPAPLPESSLGFSFQRLHPEVDGENPGWESAFF
jgi:hypothetical protein